MVCHVLISGFVQGIGFRAFVKKHAKKLGLTGWVANLPAGKAGTQDGKVEALFVGSKDGIDKILGYCRKGPPLARVKNVEVKFSDKKGNYDTFEIVH